MCERVLHLLCSNVRGLLCNWDAATSFDWNKYDIIAFNEAWQINNYGDLVKEGFVIKACGLRQNSREGGSLIF